MVERNRKIALLCTAFIAVISVCVLVSGCQRGEPGRSDDFPLIKLTEYQIEDADFGFNDRISLAPHIIKFEVISELPEYSVLVEDKEVNLSAEVEFRQFKARLISDLGNSDFATEDGTFIFVFAKSFSPSYPDFKAGQTFICSLENASGSHEGKYIIFDRSVYCISNGLAMAAYEGDDSPAKNVCGEEALLEAIREIR